MPRFQIPQKKDKKGKLRSSQASPLNTGERPLSPAERATAANIQRQLSAYRKGDFDPRYRPLFENLARIPIPREWPHPSIHPAVYITRFRNGPSRHEAEDCCRAMLAWWERHGKKVMTGDVEGLPAPSLADLELEDDVAVPADPAEAIEEVVSTVTSIERSEANMVADELVDELLEDEGPSQADPEALLLEEEDLSDRGEGAPAEQELDDEAPGDPLADDPTMGAHTAAPEQKAEIQKPTVPAAPDSKEKATDQRFPCPSKGCTMVAASQRGLTQHVNSKHPGIAAKMKKRRALPPEPAKVGAE